MLALEFERGLVPKSTVLRFKGILDQRLASDYGDLIRIDEKYAEETYSPTKDLVKTLKEAGQKLVKSIG